MINPWDKIKFASFYSKSFLPWVKRIFLGYNKKTKKKRISLTKSCKLIKFLNYQFDTIERINLEFNKITSETEEKLIRLRTRSEERSSIKSTSWSEKNFQKHLKEWSIWSIKDSEGWNLWRCQKLKTLNQFVIFWRNVTIRLKVVEFIFFWPPVETNKEIHGQRECNRLVY